MSSIFLILRKSPLTTHFIGGQRYRMVEHSYYHHRDYHRNCVFEPFHCFTFWPPRNLSGPSPGTPPSTFYAPQQWSMFSTPRMTPLTPLNPNPPAQIRRFTPTTPLDPNSRSEFIGWYVGHTPPGNLVAHILSANTISPENTASGTTSQHGTGPSSSDRGSTNTPAGQLEGVREPEAGSVPEASSEGQS